MVDPTTTNKLYAIPTHGSDVDAWDVPVNSNFSILDNNFGGLLTLGLTNANVTLSASQAQNAFIRFTGVLTGNCTITFPQLGSFYTVENLCTGAFVITLTTGFGGAQSIGLPPGEAVDVFMDGQNVKFRNLGRVGSYVDYGGSAVPAWVTACTVPPLLLCDGTTYSAITYPALNAILGTTTLPDNRGRHRTSLDGGTSRVTTAGSGIDGATRFAAGGAQNVVLDATMIPAHLHTAASVVTDPGHTHNVLYFVTNAGSGGGGPYVNVIASNGTTTGPNAAASATTGITVATTTTNTGGGLLHTNMSPTYISGITMIRAA